MFITRGLRAGVIPNIVITLNITAALNIIVIYNINRVTVNNYIV